MRALLLAALAVLVLVGASCGGADDAGPSGPEPSELAGTTWVAREIFVSGAPVGVLADAPPRIEFGGDDAFTGTTGCNSFFATVRLSPGSITIEGMGMTEMGCPEPLATQEARVGAILQAAARWSLVDGGLTIGASDGSGAIEFVRPEPVVDARLAGTTWVLETLVDGDAAMTPVRGTRVTLVFDDAAGGISGNTGCNDYGGQATIAPPDISVGPINVTEEGCAPDVMNQERLVLAALQGASTIEVEGARLTVSGPDGAALVFTAS